jgi:hypothetical protein
MSQIIESKCYVLLSLTEIHDHDLARQVVALDVTAWLQHFLALLGLGLRWRFRDVAVVGLHSLNVR